MTKLTRSQKREGSFLLVYQSSLNDDTLDEIVQANIDEFEMLVDGGDDEVVLTAKAVCEYAERADEIIEGYSVTRKVLRIGKITLAALRLALYEIDCLTEEDVPAKVAINEAIELCKKYNGDYKFVSGILGAHYRARCGES
jgi:N utilization substance protein B